MFRIKLKNACLLCGTFDKKQKQFYKCACKTTCPGLNWSDSYKSDLMELRKSNKIIQGLKNSKTIHKE